MRIPSERRPSLPDELRSPPAKLVCLYLAVAGESTVGELHRELGMSKLVLFPVLDTLESRSLVRATETGYVYRSVPGG